MTVIIMLTLYCVYWVISVLAPWCCRTWGFCYHLLSSFYALVFGHLFQGVRNVRIYIQSEYFRVLTSCHPVRILVYRSRKGSSLTTSHCSESAPCICGFVRCRTSRALSCYKISAVRLQSANTFPGKARILFIN